MVNIRFVHRGGPWPLGHPPCGRACGGAALRALHCTCPKPGLPSPEGVTLHRPVRSAGIMKSKTPERPERLTPSLFGTRPDGEHSLHSPRGADGRFQRLQQGGQPRIGEAARQPVHFGHRGGQQIFRRGMQVFVNAQKGSVNT